MEDKEHNEAISSNSANEQGDQRLIEHSSQVPPSLLPTVLQRLGLSPETSAPEISARTLIEQLHSAAWEERLNAVRRLGRLESSVPVELLATILKDDDASVRAAALSALRNAGSHVPLHLLVAALHDPDWHVREMAVLALGKQGRRVPQAVLQTALHDSDQMVREAANLALQWHTTSVELENSAAFDGQQWEQYIMQHKEGHQNSHTTGILSDEDQKTPAIDYSSDTSRPMRVLYEQQQAYAAQGSMDNQQWQSYTPQQASSGEQVQMFAPMDEVHEPSSEEQGYRERQRDPQPEPSYEYNSGAAAAHGEKVTSLPTRSRRSTGWWIVLLVIVALVFFMAGRVTDSSPFPQPNIAVPAISIEQGKSSFPAEKLALDGQFASQAKMDIADGLRLSPNDITQQLSNGKNLQDIATEQGIGVDQLHKIEFNAFTNLVNSEVKMGRMNENDAKGLLQRLQDNPENLDNLTRLLFLMPDAQPKTDSPQQP